MFANRVAGLFADGDSGDMYALVRAELERHSPSDCRPFLPGVIQELLARVERLEQQQQQQQQPGEEPHERDV